MRVNELSPPDFPPSLTTLKRSPIKLYARGNLALLHSSRSVAIVGARDATFDGLKITDRLTRWAVNQGATIVSGLALGIDGQAHMSCLAEGGNTIAVLPCSVEKIYPPTHKALAENIVEQGGLLISEYAPTDTLQNHFFTARNRLQVALSHCSVVVECRPKSGTMTHARSCLEQGHSIFCVQPRPNQSLNTHWQGPQHIVQMLGGIPLYTKDQYPELLNAMENIPLNQPSLFPVE